ncbi:MAG TPA: beta-ketoacyl-ACP synthase III [Myxococcota bacterium]|nr:beta-ketoacyl-ACP synthase III [Myxococcota bacterium]
MSECVISGTGLWVPPERISNSELVASLAAATERWNLDHKAEIEAGVCEARDLPNERFIVKASGVESRYVIEKRGVLDPERLRPHLPTRSENEPSIQCEISLVAAREALAQANRRPGEVDAVLVACSNLQRAYPAVAIEVQHALGGSGFAYDLNVACSSATFGIQAAVDAVARGHARCALVVNPELTSGHTNFALRDYHFIFGDACTAVVIERADACRADAPFAVLGTRLATRFSNNIRNDFGFLNWCEDEPRDPNELVFRQNGRKVFREVCPMVAELIGDHLRDLGLAPGQIRRFWLHQANLAMNQLIAKTVLGRMPEPDEAPVILDEFANTSSAGSVIAFHRRRADFASGELGVLCSFGAGYSIGSVVLKRC